jgi:tetratricopeptide (TPR) repeat protein
MIEEDAGAFRRSGWSWAGFMSTKPTPVKLRAATLPTKATAAAPKAEVELTLRWLSARSARYAVVAAFILLGLSVGVFFAYDQYCISQLARSVRHAFSERRIEEVREPLGSWLKNRPGSGEAYYYKARLALAADQLAEAVLAIEQARKLGFDPALLDLLSAIGLARTTRFDQAEPILRNAFRQQLEPQAMVARELARIYLSTYRLDLAAQAIERWKTHAPEDPQPYVWSNEIAARSDVEPAILIQNYRAALDRDPNLDQARLGLAQQLSNARQFNDARREFLAYLERNPKDAAALVGLGRIAMLDGSSDDSRRYFEAALAVDPRQPEALKELGQLDLRLGNFRKACERLQLLTGIDPFDHEVCYAYAQSLKLCGDDARARAELAKAVRLRKEQAEIVELKSTLRRNPQDTDARFQVAKWMLDHGHRDEGLNWTKEILRAAPRHVPTHRILAEYYEKNGDTGLANYHRLLALAGPDR